MRNAVRLAIFALSLATMPAAASEYSIWPHECRDEWHLSGERRGNILLCRMDNGEIWYSIQNRHTGRTTAPRLDNGE